MSSREIPPAEWRRFTNGFSARHEGWLVTLRTQPRKGQPEEIARDVALRGIAIDSTVGHQSVVVTVDGGKDRHLSHTISHPSSVVIEENDLDAEVSLSIANEFGVMFRVDIQTPMPASMLDGVLQEAL